MNDLLTSVQAKDRQIETCRVDLSNGVHLAAFNDSPGPIEPSAPQPAGKHHQDSSSRSFTPRQHYQVTHTRSTTPAHPGHIIIPRSAIPGLLRQVNSATSVPLEVNHTKSLPLSLTSTYHHHLRNTSKYCSNRFTAAKFPRNRWIALSHQNNGCFPVSGDSVLVLLLIPACQFFC